MWTKNERERYKIISWFNSKDPQVHRDAITATACLKLVGNFGRTFIYVATCSILLKMSGIWEINKNGFLSQRIYYFGQSLPPSSFAILNPTERNVFVPPWATPSLAGPRTPWAETAVNEQLRHLRGETRFVYCGRKSFNAAKDSPGLYVQHDVELFLPDVL